jgi:predicted metal-binding membrane protein
MLAQFTATALKRDRTIALASLAVITVLAWVYTIQLTAGMMGMDANNMEQMSMPVTKTWQTVDVLLTFLMWAVMMVAMMTPSATPMVLTFVGIKRQRQPDQASIPGTMIFLFGYLIAWSLFSAAATLVQWGLHAVTLLSDEMISVSNLFSGMLLIFAGIYQFTPLKNMCLSHCRTPLGFLMNEWQDGISGALRMGVRHGIYCVGCCWLLMAILFVAGVMNLLWSAVIAGIVIIEKVMPIPAGEWISRVIGLFVIGWGVWLLVQSMGI